MPDLKKDIVFWSGIMRDHAMFQANAFTVKEMNYVQTSKYYRNYFQSTIKNVKAPIESIRKCFQRFWKY